MPPPRENSQSQHTCHLPGARPSVREVRPFLKRQPVLDRVLVAVHVKYPETLASIGSQGLRPRAGIRPAAKASPKCMHNRPSLSPWEARQLFMKASSFWHARYEATKLMLAQVTFPVLGDCACLVQMAQGAGTKLVKAKCTARKSTEILGTPSPPNGLHKADVNQTGPESHMKTCTVAFQGGLRGPRDSQFQQLKRQRSPRSCPPRTCHPCAASMSSPALAGLF